MGKSKKSKPTKSTPVTNDDNKPATNPSETIESSSNHSGQDPAPPQSEEVDFESFYLKKVTAEFADDLDKLRSASDFNEKSVPILIDALKATAAVYSEEERAKAMGKK